jgi:hypothetical protein
MLGSIRAAFPLRELRALERQLHAAAKHELARIERELAAYVTGVGVGYVVGITHSVSGLALELSDGQRLSLNGVAQRTRRMIASRAKVDRLRPTLIEQDGVTYRLLLRGHRGDEVELHARRMVLALPAS